MEDIFVPSAARTPIGKDGGGRYALTTMCIGGGQGITAIFERS